MPVYLYRTDDGELIERRMSIAEMQRLGNDIWVPDGKGGVKQARRDRMAEYAGQGRRSSSGWPMLSDAMGIGRADPRKFMERDKKHGVPTEYVERDGTHVPKFESPGHRKAYCRSYEMNDRNGGYGDP